MFEAKLVLTGCSTVVRRQEITEEQAKLLKSAQLST